MIKFNNLLLLCFLLLGLTACTRQDNFTSAKWDSTKDGVTFVERNEIVNDLIQHYQLKGLKYRKIVQLLKYPQYKDSVSFYYEIRDDYNNMHQRTHVKNLLFHMTKDSVITKVEIYDKQFKKK
ncbi:MAG TPA: hypothetical protein VGC01_05830, partial [Mucilaginibacter sp.]